MELKLSRTPLLKNPNCASCGRVFNENGMNLQLKADHRVIDLPICPSCFNSIPRHEATVNLEQGYARMKR